MTMNHGSVLHHTIAIRKLICCFLDVIALGTKSSDTDRNNNSIILPIIVSLTTAAILGFMLLCANVWCECGKHRKQQQEEEDKQDIAGEQLQEDNNSVINHDKEYIQ